MSIVTSSFSRSISAEFFKLKRTPVVWLSVIGGITGAIIVFLLFFFFTDEFLQFNVSPWPEYYETSFNFSSLLFITPYVVLVTSMLVNAEHNSNAWKYLYTLPLNRSTIYFSKLVTIILLLAMTHLVFFAATILGGYVLGFIRPECEFLKYSPQIGHWLMIVFHAFVASLGMTALQYWISVRWKNYIIPIGIGLFGFVVSMLIAGRNSVDLFIPYTYPMGFSKMLSFTDGFPKEALRLGVFYLEWYSLFAFVLFSAIGFYEQKVSNVK